MTTDLETLEEGQLHHDDRGIHGRGIRTRHIDDHGIRRRGIHGTGIHITGRTRGFRLKPEGIGDGNRIGRDSQSDARAIERLREAGGRN